MAAARDEVEEEHQQALERAKQRRAGAHAEKHAWRERCVRPSGALGRPSLAARAPNCTSAPYFFTSSRATPCTHCTGRRRQLFCGRGAPAAEGVEARGGGDRHVLHGIGSVASVDRKVASADCTYEH